MMIKSLTHLVGHHGLAGWIVTIPPNVSLRMPAAQNARGQYAEVLDGAARVESRILQLPIIGFVAPCETPLSVSSGEEGAALILLNFPATKSSHGFEKSDIAG